MATIYDRADIYDLGIDERTYEIIRGHWRLALEGTDIETVHDVSIGTGNLTLPMAELGYKISGSDLSEVMLGKCRDKAGEMGCHVELCQADFREADKKISGKYDMVMSSGNSLPYVENSDIFTALSSMDRLVKDGGYIYLDSRNWDRILETGQRFYFYNPVMLDSIRMERMQVWDHEPDGSMTFNLIYTFEDGLKVVQREIFTEKYHPVKRSVFEESLRKLGYEIVRIGNFPAQAKIPVEEFEWYYILARKAK